MILMASIEDIVGLFDDFMRATSNSFVEIVNVDFATSSAIKQIKSYFDILVCH